MKRLLGWLRERLILLLFAGLLALQFLTWMELRSLPHYTSSSCGTSIYNGCHIDSSQLEYLAKRIAEEIHRR